MGASLVVVGLIAPLLGALGATLATGPVAGRRAQRAGCVLAALAWAAVAAGGRVVVVSGFHATPLLAAAACGAALLAVADRGPATRRSMVCASLALAAVVGGLVGGREGQSAVAVVLSLIVASLCGLVASLLQTRPARAAGAAAAAGIGLGAIGFVLAHDATGRWALPRPGTGTISTSATLAFLGAAAALALAGTVRPGRALGVLLAGGLGLGLIAASLREVSAPLSALGSGASDSLVVAVVVLGAAAAAAAAAGRAGLAFACLALAVAAGPPALTGAARLLAAGAVLAVAIDRRPAWVLGVPGGVALVLGAVGAADDVAVGLALAAGGVAALLAWRAGRSEDDGWLPDGVAVPALVAGAWLFVAPTSWSWTGPTGLDAYDDGAARAVAAALLTVVLAGLWDARHRSARASKAPARVDLLAEVPVISEPPRPDAGEETTGPEFPAPPGPLGPERLVRRRQARRAAARERRGLP